MCDALNGRDRAAPESPHGRSSHLLSRLAHCDGLRRLPAACFGAEAMLRPRLVSAGLTFGLFTLLGLLFASQTVLSSRFAGRPVSWPGAIGYALTTWYLWGLLTPVVVWLGHRVP